MRLKREPLKDVFWNLLLRPLVFPSSADPLLLKAIATLCAACRLGGIVYFNVFYNVHRPSNGPSEDHGPKWTKEMFYSCNRADTHEHTQTQCNRWLWRWILYSQVGVRRAKGASFSSGAYYGPCACLNYTDRCNLHCTPCFSYTSIRVCTLAEVLYAANGGHEQRRWQDRIKISLAYETLWNLRRTKKTRLKRSYALN